MLEFKYVIVFIIEFLFLIVRHLCSFLANIRFNLKVEILNTEIHLGYMFIVELNMSFIYFG